MKLFGTLATTMSTRMWANAQRDGRPAEYRWRPLFNAARFRWHSLLECRAVTLPRCETRWNLLGCPKLTNRSQPSVGRSSPYCEDVLRRYCCLTRFFRLSISASVAKIQPDKVVRWCRDGDFLATFLRPVCICICMPASCLVVLPPPPVARLCLRPITTRISKSWIWVVARWTIEMQLNREG